MPLYEYYCSTCESKFERLRSMSQADEKAACPTCSTPSGRVISLFASFSKSSDGSVSAVAGSGGGCSTCGGGSCASCAV
ncbi:MAG: zinc ribbon domain-containing protein [Chloroflexi bacterium]|nr:zinc ribbon domain-containing protein [Chloroflexota bacterium]